MSTNKKLGPNDATDAVNGNLFKKKNGIFMVHLESEQWQNSFVTKKDVLTN